MPHRLVDVLPLAQLQCWRWLHSLGRTQGCLRCGGYLRRARARERFWSMKPHWTHFTSGCFALEISWRSPLHRGHAFKRNMFFFGPCAYRSVGRTPVLFPTGGSLSYAFIQFIQELDCSF